ncbi:hypothetical protein [Vibrio furnissii]|uniref:hypothetical protein n=1 Tax=Vibrio furnissii TaxID=29494 RepID=UPI001EE9CE46|nr:hypothetical protein [Vibrio furnissii]MCG6267265.1 hypothetical protein [Vibrio furnissii]
MALGGATRVSIPFSSLDPGTSNAPAFSLIFALLFIYCDKNFNGILKGVLLLLTVSALVMCGSRSGIFIIVIYFLLFRGSVKSTIFLFVPVIILMFVVLSQTYNSESLVFKLVERALDFELNTDESANQRVFKQLSAFISTEEQFFLLGKGHENTAIVWYDGLIGNLQTFGGLISIILFYSSYLVLRRVRPEYFIFFDLLLLASFISEYALTSYVLVMVLFLSISSIHSKLRLV